MATCSRGPLSSAAQNSARRLSNTLSAMPQKRWNQMSFYMFIPKRTAGGSMPDDAFLRHVERQLLLIAKDCFDLRAKENLRLLQAEVARRLAVPPIILSKDTNSDPEVTGQ
jgi:hypothetical protein